MKWPTWTLCQVSNPEQKRYPVINSTVVSCSEHKVAKQMRISHLKDPWEFAKKLASAKIITTHLFISPWQWRHKLKNCNPARGCACCHQVIKAAQQLHHSDRFHLPLQEEALKTNESVTMQASKMYNEDITKGLKNLIRLQPIHTLDWKGVWIRKTITSVKK